MGVGAAVAGLVGAAISGYGSYRAAKKQEKASAAAAAAAQKAANKAAVVSTGKVAESSVESAGKGERAVQQAAARRFSVEDTVNKFAQSGLRKTLN